MDIITKLGLDKYSREDLINIINEHSLSDAQIKQSHNQYEIMAIHRCAIFELTSYQNKLDNWFGWLYLYRGNKIWGVEGINIARGKKGKRFFIDEEFAIQCYHANRALIKKYMHEDLSANIKEFWDGAKLYG